MLVAFIVTCLALTAAALPVTPGPGAQGAELPAQSAAPPEPAGQQPGPQVLLEVHPNQQGQSQQQQQQPLTVADRLPEPLHLPQYYLPMHHHQPLPWFPHSALPMGMPFQPAMQQPFQPHFQPHFQPILQPVMQPVIQPALQPVQQPIQQPALQPVQQPALQPVQQPALQPAVQGAEVPLQPNHQAQHPMMLHPYGYFPFYPPLQGNQQYTPYRYPVMYQPAAPAAPEVQANHPPNPPPNAPVNPPPAPPASPVAAGEALVQGPPASPPAAQPTEQQEQQQQQQPQPQNPHIVYMVHQPMTAQLGGLSSEELEMVAKLSKRGFFLSNLQPNVRLAGRPLGPQQVEAPGEPNEGPAGLEGPRRRNPGPPAASSSSRAPGATPGVRSGTQESNSIKHP